jgi:hypothetical protein
MFAPPICKRRWRNNAFSVPPGPTKTAATQRTSQRAGASNQAQRDPQRPGLRRRCLDERGSRHSFRLREREEGGDSKAQSSASGASHVLGASN